MGKVEKRWGPHEEKPIIKHKIIQNGVLLLGIYALVWLRFAIFGV